MAASRYGWNRKVSEPGRHCCWRAKQSEGHLVLMLHKGAGSVYGLLLVLPDNLLDKALAAITARKGITLREVGELDIT
jgi:hypothetical protein